MSADNSVCVQKKEGKWYVWHQMGDDYDIPEGQHGWNTEEVAMAQAVRLYKKLAVVEYGIIVLDEL